VGHGPDGHSLWPSFVNIPCEYLESYYPLIIDRWETIPDTGGAGLHRGGNGDDVTYRFLEVGTIAIHDDRWLTYPWGVKGGEPGACGSKWIERADGTLVVLPSKVHDIAVGNDDVLHFVTWGDPLARDPELVCKEVRRGLVTQAGARTNGVMCDDDGDLGAAATAALRDAMRERSEEPLPLFNRGDSMENLLANSFTETGLPAPTPPLVV